METFKISDQQKEELEMIGNFYRESIYSQKNLPDALSFFSKKLDEYDTVLSQTLLPEVILYNKLIQNRDFFSLLRTWIGELYDVLLDILLEDVSFTIECRRKSVQSTIRKMVKNYFEKSSIDLSDLIAFRIILDSMSNKDLIPICYLVADTCINFFRYKRCTLCTPSKQIGPSRLMKDYIAEPKKKNGYQSIHLTFKNLNKDIFECQIRTLDMHENAEIGKASHFNYKDAEYQWTAPYINLDPSKVNIPNFRVLQNGNVYDKIGLLDAMHIEQRSKSF